MRAPHHRAPERITPTSLADYFEVLTRAVFQAGIDWRVIDAKWDGFREAFGGFDPERIVAFTPEHVERLMGDARVVRNRRKIEATVANAGEMLVLDRDTEGGFRAYLRSFGGDYEALAKDLHKHFKFLGDTGTYYFLHVVGEPVPKWEDWAQTHGPR